LPKTLKQLDTLGKEPESSTFEKLITEPGAFAVAPKPVFSDEARRALDKLPSRFSDSQRYAFKHICKFRLTLLWGPPGTGKTHCLALACIEMFEMAWRSGSNEKFRILMTAFTKTAIEAFRSKFSQLLELNKPKLSGWAQGRQPGLFTMLGGLEAMVDETLLSDKFLLICSTVWSVHKNIISYPEKRVEFEVLMIDEASQLQVADSAIPIYTIRPKGRIVICGDHLQLRPLIRAAFPEPTRLDDPLLATGILQCLLRDKSNRRFESLLNARDEAVLLVRLKEQRRMCAPLARFTETLYAPFVGAAQRHPLALKQWQQGTRQAQMADLCHGNALVSVMLRGDAVFEFLSYEAELKYECDVVCRMVEQFVRASDDAYSIFVITPHRAQRSTMSSALAMRNLSQQITCDTVDRMQGKEADIVIVCYSFLSQDRVDAELDFVFDINRINVAVSRAKQLVVLLVVSPPIAVANTPQPQSAYGHILQFYNHSQRYEWRCRMEGNELQDEE
jgi:DNA replication ATP-dependent helicase Dna2